MHPTRSETLVSFFDSRRDFRLKSLKNWTHAEKIHYVQNLKNRMKSIRNFAGRVLWRPRRIRRSDPCGSSGSPRPSTSTVTWNVSVGISEASESTAPISVLRTKTASQKIPDEKRPLMENACWLHKYYVRVKSEPPGNRSRRGQSIQIHWRSTKWDVTEILLGIFFFSFTFFSSLPFPFLLKLDQRKRKPHARAA